MQCLRLAVHDSHVVNPWVLGGVLNHPISRIVGINQPWWSPMIKHVLLLAVIEVNKPWWSRMIKHLLAVIEGHVDLMKSTAYSNVAMTCGSSSLGSWCRACTELPWTGSWWRGSWLPVQVASNVIDHVNHGTRNTWFDQQVICHFQNYDQHTMIIDLPLSNWSWLIRCLVSTRLANNFKSLMNWWRQH